jgi:hypothetical protein
MIVVKNEFDFYVNCFYQAVGLSKNAPAKGLLGEIDFLPEINEFRKQFKHAPEIDNSVKELENKGEYGTIELELLLEKLRDDYDLPEMWFSEIYYSIDKYLAMRNDMTSYRISFQMATYAVNEVFTEFLPEANKEIPKREIIATVLNDMFYKDYWQGDKVLERIKFARTFKSLLNFSDKWILEYIIRLF